MRQRFEGEDGQRLLLTALMGQVIVNGDQQLANELLRTSELQEFGVGDILISQECDENDIFFIVSGSVNVEANGRLVAVRQAGTHVGEMALIDCKARRCATVKAAEASVVVKVAEPEFSRIAGVFPDLWRRIAVELCGRLRNRNNTLRWPNEVPNVFICSSAENVSVAEQIQVGLDHHSSVVRVWTDQVFGPMKYTMEDLEREIISADFAVAVIMGEDVVRSRKRQAVAPRDNVIFELGLFMGQLGRQRTIMVVPRGINLKMPSDLLGLNPLSYSPPTDPKNASLMAAALGPVCTQLKATIDKLGPR
ncbi:MAG TPA: TIR domain-containing protein [Pirellulales bacterium]|jgi:predicted nucleotide-binding protein|nr:TIR domain-containing protein [Pirellulales bacterium]